MIDAIVNTTHKTTTRKSLSNYAITVGIQRTHGNTEYCPCNLKLILQEASFH